MKKVLVELLAEDVDVLSVLLGEESRRGVGSEAQKQAIWGVIERFREASIFARPVENDAQLTIDTVPADVLNWIKREVCKDAGGDQDDRTDEGRAMDGTDFLDPAAAGIVDKNRAKWKEDLEPGGGMNNLLAAVDKAVLDGFSEAARAGNPALTQLMESSRAAGVQFAFVESLKAAIPGLLDAAFHGGAVKPEPINLFVPISVEELDPQRVPDEADELEAKFVAECPGAIITPGVEVEKKPLAGEEFYYPRTTPTGELVDLPEGVGGIVVGMDLSGPTVPYQRTSEYLAKLQSEREKVESNLTGSQPVTDSPSQESGCGAGAVAGEDRSDRTGEGFHDRLSRMLLSEEQKVVLTKMAGIPEDNPILDAILKGKDGPNRLEKSQEFELIKTRVEIPLEDEPDERLGQSSYENEGGGSTLPVPDGHRPLLEREVTGGIEEGSDSGDGNLGAVDMTKERATRRGVAITINPEKDAPVFSEVKPEVSTAAPSVYKLPLASIFDAMKLIHLRKSKAETAEKLKRPEWFVNSLKTFFRDIGANVHPKESEPFDVWRAKAKKCLDESHARAFQIDVRETGCTVLCAEAPEERRADGRKKGGV